MSHKNNVFPHFLTRLHKRHSGLCLQYPSSRTTQYSVPIIKTNYAISYNYKDKPTYQLKGLKLGFLIHITCVSLREIRINGHKINWSKNDTYLSVAIDKNLTFNKHISDIIRKAIIIRSMLYTVLNRKSPISSLTKLQLYIWPVLSYVGPSWGPLLSRNNWKRIKSVQNICFRPFLACPYFVSNINVVNIFRHRTIREDIRNNSKTLFYKNYLSKY